MIQHVASGGEACQDLREDVGDLQKGLLCEHAAESTHRMHHRELMCGNAARVPWVFASTRLLQNLAEVDVELETDSGKACFPRVWSLYKAVVQKRKVSWSLLRPPRMCLAFFRGTLYRTGLIGLGGWGCKDRCEAQVRVWKG